MDRRIRPILFVSAAAGLVAALSACGPDDHKSPANQAPNTGVEWPADAFGLAGPVNPNALPPLPVAEPLQASPGTARTSYIAARPANPSAGYGYAPTYYDEGYYRDQPADWYDAGPSAGDGNAYAMLGLAAVLGGVLGNSPPDYGFGYGDTQPWVWETGDRYRRYAEPIDGGYRYYYYAPDRDRPFLVSDPYYSYAYNGERIAYIYDRDGRVIDSRRAMRQRMIGERYATRGYDLYRASGRDRFGVSAPLWAQRRDQIAREQAQWERARERRRAWQEWDRRHDDVITARWTQERAVRRYASDRFENWRRADYRGQAPRFYREAARDKQLRKEVLARQAILYRRAEQRQAQDRRERIAMRNQQRESRLQDQRIRQQMRAEAMRDQRRDQQQAQMVRRNQQARQQEVRRSQQARVEQARARQERQKQQQMALRERQMRAQQGKARRAQVREARVREVRQQQVAQRERQARARQDTARQAHVRQERQQQMAQRERQGRVQQAKARQVQMRQARQQQQASQRERQARVQQARARQSEARQRQQSVQRERQARAQQGRGHERRDVAFRGDKR